VATLLARKTLEELKHLCISLYPPLAGIEVLHPLHCSLYSDYNAMNEGPLHQPKGDGGKGKGHDGGGHPATLNASSGTIAPLAAAAAIAGNVSLA
jgi:hypothetical protein